MRPGSTVTASNIFTAEIAGRATFVFAALDQVHALAFVNDSFIRAELRDLRTLDGAPLWDGAVDVMIRPADLEEQDVWESHMIEDVAQGVHESREDAVKSNGFAFLVDYLEPDE